MDVLAHLIFGLHLIIIKPIGDTLGLGGMGFYMCGALTSSDAVSLLGW